MEKVGEMIFFVFVASLSRMLMVTCIDWEKDDTIGLTGAVEKKRILTKFLIKSKKRK